MNGVANITPTDVNALAFSRTTTQVLNIVYAGGASGNYGFFPQGLNGAISLVRQSGPFSACGIGLKMAHPSLHSPAEV